MHRFTVATVQDPEVADKFLNEGDGTQTQEPGRRQAGQKRS